MSNFVLVAIWVVAVADGDQESAVGCNAVEVALPRDVHRVFYFVERVHQDELNNPVDSHFPYNVGLLVHGSFGVLLCVGFKC